MLGRLHLSPESAISKKLQPAHLVILSYLAFEGAQSGQTIQDVFYSHTKDPRNNRDVALSHLRASGLVQDIHDDIKLAEHVTTDLALIEEAKPHELAKILTTYCNGPFLQGKNGKSLLLVNWLEEKRLEVSGIIYQKRYSLIVKDKPIQANLSLAEDIAEHHPEQVIDEKESTILYRILFLAQSSKLKNIRKSLLELEHDLADLESKILEEATADELALYQRQINPVTATTDVNTKTSLTSFPSPISSLQGRSKDIAAILEQLKEVRLLSLVGLGGVGKTRLALAAAKEVEKANLFKDGIVYVEMETVHPSQFLNKLAEKLKLKFGFEEALQALQHYFANKHMLLILDNFEELISQASEVKQLLEGAHNLHILITSRELLNLSGETPYSVEGLPYPTIDVSNYLTELTGETKKGTIAQQELEEEFPPLASDYENYDAIRLFIIRRLANLTQFAVSDDNIIQLIRICQLVGGLPLAIEMVASISTKTLNTILLEMHNKGIDFYKNSYVDSPDRHKTLRAIFDYTWETLSAGEQQVLRQIGLFEDGFTRKAAQQIVPNFDEHIRSLSQKSFVSFDAEKNRFKQHPLIHTYSSEKLADTSADYEAVSKRHAAYYLWLLRTILEGTVKQKEESMSVLKPEIANFWVAWRWVSESQDLEEIDTSCDALRFFFDTLTRYGEGEALLDIARVALDKNDDLHKPALAKVYANQGWLLNQQNLFDKAQYYSQTALELINTEDIQTRLFCLNTLGSSYDYQGYFDNALLSFKQANDIAPTNTGFSAATNLNIANVFRRKGNFDESKKNYQKAYAIFKEEKKFQTLAQTLLAYGDMLIMSENHDKAENKLTEAFSLAKQYDNDFVVVRSYFSFAKLELAKGNISEAQSYIEETIDIAKQQNRKSLEADALSLYADILLNQNPIEVCKINNGLLQSIETNEKSRRMPELLGGLITLLKLYLQRSQDKEALNLWGFLMQKEQQQKMIYSDRTRLVEIQEGYELNSDLDNQNPLSIELVIDNVRNSLRNN